MNDRSFRGIGGKTVLVTGASSGIGEAVSREAARRGARVIMVARRAVELERIGTEIREAGGSVDWITADLSVAEDRDRLLEEVQQRSDGVDVLVSNAGAGWYGPVWEMPWDSVDSLIQLNVVASVHLAVAFMPRMIERRRGHIIAIGSIAGSLPAQGIAVYAATKAFVESFCRSAYRETRRSGVSVSLVKPGVVTTPFFAVAQRSGGRRVPFSRHGVTPARVARCVVRLMRRPRRLVYVPFYLRVVPVLGRVFGWAMDLLGPVHFELSRRVRMRRPQMAPPEADTRVTVLNPRSE